jgi:hypothetical protein
LPYYEFFLNIFKVAYLFLTISIKVKKLITE